MSSPTTTPRRTPKRNTSKRSPLQERTPSQKNEVAGRLKKESQQELTDADIFTSTPFPTKPQHVLLPSTIRKQRSRQHVGNELPNIFFNNRSLPEVSNSSRARQDERRARRAPNLQLKKSVTALRDMYEAQAEHSRPSTAYRSRPSTAANSPALRPTSSRLRSLSSSEGLSGRSAWEMLGLPRVSAVDLATLPTLSEDVLQRLDSEHSFASRLRNHPGTSSPNYHTFDISSPNIPTYHDVATSSDPIEAGFGTDDGGKSSPNVVQFDYSPTDAVSSPQYGLQESSPNIVQLHHTSSVLNTDAMSTPPDPREAESSPNLVPLQHSSSDTTTGFTSPRGESSPNFLKLGTSSPKKNSSPTPSEASTVSRKRKRSDIERSTFAGRTPLFFGARRQTQQPSSPTARHAEASHENSVQSSEMRAMHSSPPEVGSARSQSSPVVRLHGGRDRVSLQSAHTNLQSILSSSPGPPPERPIVRAPKVDQFDTIALQKRQASGQSAIERETAPESLPVPPVASPGLYRFSSPEISRSRFRSSSLSGAVYTDDLDEDLDTESIAPAKAYMHVHDLNSSHENIISDADRHEASDGLAALPRQQSSFAAVLSNARSASFLASSSNSSKYDSFRTSLDDRLQSMRSFTHGQNDSLRSWSRPGSSASYMDSNALPTWARRYYSGFYRDSYHYLYQSSSNLPYTVVHVAPPATSRPLSDPMSLRNSSSYETISTRSNLRRSWSRSVRSVKDFVAPVIAPVSRPRLNVRQSHLMPGVGPLVSNPVRPKSEIISRPPSAYNGRKTMRRVSAPLSTIDPRAHWSGLTEEPETAEEAEKLEDYDYTGTPRYSTSSSLPPPHHAPIHRTAPPMRFLRLPTPHLHHDRRLNTGSEASQGFGAPYNARPRWHPSPAGFGDELGRPSWFTVDVRDMQVVCFMAGFICPLTWFVAAFLPLPTRPSNYHDLEKTAARQSQLAAQDGDFDNYDIIARLRLEKHIRGIEEVKWQNARWWRRMNRWMCCVGFVVLTVIIVLAVIGSTSHWK